MATIKKQGRGYKITVSNGYDIHGRQIRHHMTWIPDSNLTEKQVEKELNRQVVLFEEIVKTGGVRVDGNIRFQSFSERFMRDHIAVNRKPNTVARYERDLKRINEAIGHLKLSQITPSDINAFLIPEDEQVLALIAYKRDPSPHVPVSFLSWDCYTTCLRFCSLVLCQKLISESHYQSVC